MKKILSFISLFLILFVLCSCTKYEDLVPNSDDYASWDGQYIYKGNYRSKTTGEDEERLIKNINYLGKTYYIDEYDYAIYEDNLYFSFFTKSNKELTECDSSFLIKYITKDKTYEILYANIDFCLKLDIEKVYKDYIYCEHYENTGKYDYYIYSYTANDFITIEDVNDIWFFENDVFLEIDNTLKHSTSTQINFKTIINLFGSDVTIKDDENSEYIKILSNKNIAKGKDYCSLGYFNKKTYEYKTIIDLEEKKEIYYINEEYFILYESKSYEYVMNIKERDTHILNVNCKLCKVDLKTLTYNEVYEFDDPNASYTGGFVIDDIYYFKRAKVRKGWFIFYGGTKTKTYKLNLNSLKLSRDYDKVVNNKPLKTNGVKYNEYLYYLSSDTCGAILRQTTVYYLYKKNMVNNKQELMQFFVYDYDMVQDNYEGTRSSKDMWYNSIEFNERNVLILNY